MNFAEWSKKWRHENIPPELLTGRIDALVQAALTAGYQRQVAERAEQKEDQDQAMIEDLVENVDTLKSAWAVDFVTSIEGKRYGDLSPRQKAKVAELWEAL